MRKFWRILLQVLTMGICKMYIIFSALWRKSKLLTLLIWKRQVFGKGWVDWLFFCHLKQIWLFFTGLSLPSGNIAENTLLSQHAHNAHQHYVDAHAWKCLLDFILDCPPLALQPLCHLTICGWKKRPDLHGVNNNYYCCIRAFQDGLVRDKNNKS